jgi:hypothetical protein
MTPPRERFDPERFWAIGRGLRRRPGTAAAIDRAMQAVRADVDVSAFLRKRAGSSSRLKLAR